MSGSSRVRALDCLKIGDLGIESAVEDGYRYAAELFVALRCPRQIEFDYPAIAMGHYPAH